MSSPKEDCCIVNVYRVWCWNVWLLTKCFTGIGAHGRGCEVAGQLYRSRTLAVVTEGLGSVGRLCKHRGHRHRFYCVHQASRSIHRFLLNENSVRELTLRWPLVQELVFAQLGWLTKYTYTKLIIVDTHSVKNTSSFDALTYCLWGSALCGSYTQQQGHRI
jgi:hypothetical protein